MYLAFLDLAVTPGRLALGKAVLTPLAIGYKLGVVPGNLCRAAAVRVGFSGVPLALVEQHGAMFAEHVLPTVIRPEAMERINWHKLQGDTIAVVSGALEVALAHWCASQDLNLIASRLEHRNGILTGRYLGEQCVRAEKSRRINEQYILPSYDTIYAYGDTPEDLDMLALANKRFYKWQEQHSSAGANNSFKRTPGPHPALTNPSRSGAA